MAWQHTKYQAKGIMRTITFETHKFVRACWVMGPQKNCCSRNSS